jgi:hypothetical protein
MTPNRKPPTTTETLKDIQQNRIAYGADERARYVEHVCGILLNDRFWPGASDDMFAIEDHEAKDALPSLVDLFEFGVPPSGGLLSRLLPAKAGTLNSWDASVRTGSGSDRTISPHLKLLGHLNQTNAPPNGPPVPGRIAIATLIFDL